MTYCCIQNQNQTLPLAYKTSHDLRFTCFVLYLSLLFLGSSYKSFLSLTRACQGLSSLVVFAFVISLSFIEFTISFSRLVHFHSYGLVKIFQGEFVDHFILLGRNFSFQLKKNFFFLYFRHYPKIMAKTHVKEFLLYVFFRGFVFQFTFTALNHFELKKNNYVR